MSFCVSSHHPQTSTLLLVGELRAKKKTHDTHWSPKIRCSLLRFFYEKLLKAEKKRGSSSALDLATPEFRCSRPPSCGDQTLCKLFSQNVSGFHFMLVVFQPAVNEWIPHWCVIKRQILCWSLVSTILTEQSMFGRLHSTMPLFPNPIITHPDDLLKWN